MTLFLVIVAVILIVRTFVLYRVNTDDTLIAFTGGLGSGKTLWSVTIATSEIVKARIRWWVYKVFRGDKTAPPQLYSSIPVRWLGGMSRVLTPDHLLLQTPIEQGSVVLIDEIGGFCSQFDYKIKNVEYFDDFIRYFRHYIGGKIIVNDQCSENILLQVRRRINTVYNLQRCKTWGIPFGKKFFASVRVRNITISEEIKTIEEGHTEEDHQLALIVLPWRRAYATRCYKVRYDDLGTDFDTDTYSEELVTRRRLRMVVDNIPDKIGLKQTERLKRPPTETPQKPPTSPEEETPAQIPEKTFQNPLDKA